MRAKKTAGSPFFSVFTPYPLQMDFWIRKYSDSREN